MPSVYPPSTRRPSSDGGLLLALAAILVLASAVRLGCAFALRIDVRATFLRERPPAGERVEGYTTPSWIALLAGLRHLDAPLLGTARVLGIASGTGAVLLAAAVATRAAPRRCRVEDARRAVSRRCGAARSGPSSSGGIECGTQPRTASTRAQAQRWPAIHAMVARSRGEFSMPVQ